jgi:hypothetical protein
VHAVPVWMVPRTPWGREVQWRVPKFAATANRGCGVHRTAGCETSKTIFAKVSNLEQFFPLWEQYYANCFNAAVPLKRRTAVQGQAWVSVSTVGDV